MGLLASLPIEDRTYDPWPIRFSVISNVGFKIIIFVMLVIVSVLEF